MEKQIEQPCPLSNKRMLFLVLNYFIGYNLLLPMLLRYFVLWLDPTARMLPEWAQYMAYLYMIGSSVIAAYPLLKESWRPLRNHPVKMIKRVFLLMIVYYIASVFLNLLIMQFTDTTTSANQSEIIAASQSSPWLTLFSALIYAPIVEEIVFRGVLYRGLRPRYSHRKAALISAFTFGYIHVMASLFAGNFADMIYLFAYALIGFFLVLAYEQNDTIYGSILLHFINNAFAFLLLLS